MLYIIDYRVAILVNHTLMVYACKLNELFLFFTPKDVFVLKHVAYSLYYAFTVNLCYLSLVSTFFTA